MQKSLKKQAQEETQKDKTTVKDRHKGEREAGARAEAEKNKSTRSERAQEKNAGGQDQPHTGPPPPNQTSQISSLSPPAAGPSGTRTPLTPKKGGSVINQASGNADKEKGGTVPLDLSLGGKKDKSSREK